MAPSSGARLLSSGLVDRELARGHEFRFHLQPWHNPNKVLLRKQFLDNAGGKHGRGDWALRVVRRNRRQLLWHIGHDINAGGGLEALRMDRGRLHRILGFYPSPRKGCRGAGGEDEAGHPLTRNDMGVARPMIGQTFFTEKVAWSERSDGAEVAIRGFP